MTKTAFAEMANVSIAAIVRITKHGNKLEVAMVKKRIDANHPAAQAYLNAPLRAVGKVLDAAKAAVTPNPSGQAALQKKKKMADNPDLDEKLLRSLPPDIRELAHLPLLKLVDIFGTDVRFLDWLKAVEKVEAIATKRIANATTLKELVSVSLIKKGVIDPIDAIHRRLLTDGVRTITQRLFTKFQAGTSPEEAETFMKKEISIILAPVTDKVGKALEDMKKC
jgi:hypothetical protein